MSNQVSVSEVYVRLSMCVSEQAVERNVPWWLRQNSTTADMFLMQIHGQITDRWTARTAEEVLLYHLKSVSSLGDIDKAMICFGLTLQLDLVIFIVRYYAWVYKRDVLSPLLCFLGLPCPRGVNSFFTVSLLFFLFFFPLFTPFKSSISLLFKRDCVTKHTALSSISFYSSLLSFLRFPFFMFSHSPVLPPFSLSLFFSLCDPWPFAAHYPGGTQTRRGNVRAGVSGWQILTAHCRHGQAWCHVLHNEGFYPMTPYLPLPFIPHTHYLTICL